MVLRLRGVTQRSINSSNLVFLEFQLYLQHCALVLIFIINNSNWFQFQGDRTQIAPQNAKPMEVGRSTLANNDRLFRIYSA